MKTFSAKILVRNKPTVKDVKCMTLKQAVETIMPIVDLTCQTGTYYILTFKAYNQGEALNAVERIAKDLLSNEIIETYEIKNLEEVYEES